MTTPVIVGDADDPHVAAVQAHLREPAAVLDLSLLSRARYVLDDEALVIDDGDSPIRLRHAEARRGWLRRIAPHDWSTGIAAESRAFAETSAWISLLSAWLRQPGTEWLTTVDGAVRAENKLIVHAAAARSAVRTPQTVVTNDPSHIPESLGDRVVAKPLGPGHYIEAGASYSLFASAVRRSELTAAALAPAPFLLQEALRAVKHRRVVTVEESAWSAALDAADLPLDWRSEPRAHTSFRVDDAPAEVLEGAAAVAHELGLGYSSQDWVETTSGEHVLLDVNPGGQWLFLPDAVSQPVARAIAEWLHG